MRGREGRGRIKRGISGMCNVAEGRSVRLGTRHRGGLGVCVCGGGGGEREEGGGVSGTGGPPSPSPGGSSHL